jgi:hypothetical protein
MIVSGFVIAISMVAEKSEEISNRPAVASSQLWGSTRFSALNRGSPCLAGWIGTFDRPCGSLYIYMCGPPPWHAGHAPSGLTLPVDSRHKTGTGEVAEWLKAALC